MGEGEKEMCVAVAGKVIRLDGIYASIDIMGVESTVNIELLEEVRAGEYILVHAGCGIQKIDARYFEYLQQLYKEFLGDESSYGEA